MTTTVTVARDDLTFSAAHFLTIPGHKCERLHGHNYAVSVTVEGPVDERTGFVIDFADLKKILRPALDRVDHRLLIPTTNPAVRLEVVGETSTVWVGDERRYQLPTTQVAPIEITETTAERLAEHFAGLLWRALEANEISRLVVSVEESPGQSASCTRRR